MCGIVGIFNYQGKADLQLSHVVRMANTMKHRGPDDEGYVVFQNDYEPLRFFAEDTPIPVRQAHTDLNDAQQYENLTSVIALGHRRLSILDLSPAGHQPMRSADGRYWIVYNGEIYNYIELRDELKRLGHLFKTASDTEVILAAYQQWGVDCQQKFNGDWAIIIYDTIQKEIFVSRDRFGIKPLYYYQDKDRILFSSEIKGLLAHPAIKMEPNLDYFKSYLESGAKEWIKETAFANIFRFPFAHYGIIPVNAASTEWQAKRYWEMKPNLSQEPYNENLARQYAKQYYELLKDSVRIRLRSDVPVGCALSGGLDSSSIVYLVNEILKENGSEQRVKTFSLIHTTDETRYCDESEFIHAIGELLNLDTNYTEPRVLDIPKIADRIIWHWETPPESHSMSSFFTTELAKNIGCVVTLDGQGADEQLAGYYSYLSSFFNMLPAAVAAREAYVLYLTTGMTRSIMKALVLSFVLRSRMLAWVAKKIKGRVHSKLLLNNSLVTSVETGLINLIHFSDRRSMMFSIESRMPFMDYRLVELNNSVPAAFKIAKGYTKYYARLAFDGKLPAMITWRKDKMGWPTPDKEWFSGELGNHVSDLISSSKLLRRIYHGHMPSFDKNNTAIFIRLWNVANCEKVFFKTIH